MIDLEYYKIIASDESEMSQKAHEFKITLRDLITDIEREKATQPEPPTKTATQYWQEKFGELPQTDSDKLAVAMMAEYLEHVKQPEPPVMESFTDGLNVGVDYCNQQIGKLLAIYGDTTEALDASQKYLDVRNHLASKITERS